VSASKKGVVGGAVVSSAVAGVEDDAAIAAS